ncbi:hypothetical protein KZI27_01795 [Curtobacterium sp. TC1]|uniref:hypothetical protein n=1 Tax=Curtobacterium sp. TC1 TaxID=2862880 RepID=UPI001C9B0362|nr:hypothetical protein [Curtobacterium sp. TC1]QZQ55628.1 hypothetical protein KZI27_01795 [Curtobacterium sp. TC1]
MTHFVRFQSAVPNRRGRFPGIFALANGLRDAGRLTDTDRRWLAAANERAEGMYVDPSTVEPGCFDEVRNPGARSWFRTDATDLLTMSAEYLDLLDRYGVGWVELRTDRPGRTTYEDDVQIVAVPLAYPADWPFAPAVSTGVAAPRC